MRHSETEEADAELTPAQELALGALMAGNRKSEAASAAGVSRATLHRWMQEPTFIAAHNSRRTEMVTGARTRMLSLLQKALGVVEQALDDGDTKAAMTILQGLGMLDGQSPQFGSEDPGRVAKGQQAAARQEDLMDILSL